MNSGKCVAMGLLITLLVCGCASTNGKRLRVEILDLDWRKKDQIEAQTRERTVVFDREPKAQEGLGVLGAVTVPLTWLVDLFSLGGRATLLRTEYFGEGK
jgi:hypothetical protein